MFTLVAGLPVVFDMMMISVLQGWSRLVVLRFNAVLASLEKLSLISLRFVVENLHTRLDRRLLGWVIGNDSPIDCSVGSLL